MVFSAPIFNPTVSITMEFPRVVITSSFSVLEIKAGVDYDRAHLWVCSILSLTAMQPEKQPGISDHSLMSPLTDLSDILTPRPWCILKYLGQYRSPG